jgi:guanylate kinase
MTGGRLFVVAAPSGAGKTSLVKELLRREPLLRVCVSHTTRRQRPNEADGRDYHFVDRASFEQMVADGAFLEHAAVFDNFYGTSLQALQDAFGAGFDVVLEIDWQGARQVREKVPECISIFILPPSRQALEQRLRDRRTDSPEVIARRLSDAVTDMGHYGEFDCVVVNDDFELAVGDLRGILAAARDSGAEGAGLGPDRPDLAPLVAGLLRT